MANLPFFKLSVRSVILSFFPPYCLSRCESVRPLPVNVRLPICLPTMHLVSVSSRLSVYLSLGKCVHPAVCLALSESECPPVCQSSIHWVSESAHHQLCKCVCPSVCQPCTWNCSCVRPVRWVSLSACLSVYHIVGQCVHLFDCLLFIVSVCSPVCLPSIQWVTVSAHHPLCRYVCPYACLPFNELLCPPF